MGLYLNSVEEFEATVKRLRFELVKYTQRRYRLSYDDAEDAVQDGLINAYLRLDGAVQQHGENFDMELHIRTWVDYSTLEHIRRKKPNTVSYEQLPEGRLVDHSHRELLIRLTQQNKPNRKEFWRTVRQVLPSELQRRVLWLVAEDNDLKEAASQLGISHDNARRLMSEARQRLLRSRAFCEVCLDLGHVQLPPEWVVGELLFQAFTHIRRQSVTQPSEVSNSAEVTTVQEATVRRFWMIVDSCLDNETDRQLLRLVQGDYCLDVEQAAKVLCLDTKTARQRFTQALRKLRCSEKLYEFCIRNRIITSTEVS